MDPDDLTIAALIEEAHATAVDKGWYDQSRTLPELIALAHSELSEALEEHKDGRDYDEVYWKISELADTSYAGGEFSDNSFQKLDEKLRTRMLASGDAKPEGIPIELADLLIRVADMCGHYKIDLERALRLKMSFNETRPQRHGGKVV